MEKSSILYDSKLDLIAHYKIYPEMKVWVGCNYPVADKKLLIIGESHYLEINSRYHLDPQVWYAGVLSFGKEDWGWIKTRNIISNGISNNWKEKSKNIYRNIEKALFESQIFQEKPVSAFTEICFMNYFQRPAEITGKSINVSSIDSKISSIVLQGVVDAIEPNIIIFTSSLAWRHAQQSGIIAYLKTKNIAVSRSPHPGMPWWNKVSKKYGNLTGKHHFIKFINKQCDRNTVLT